MAIKKALEDFDKNPKEKKYHTESLDESKSEKEQPEPNLLKSMKEIEVGNDPQLQQDKHGYVIKRKPTTEETYGISNSKLRSLCIAAFLKCVYGYINLEQEGQDEFSNMEQKRKVRENMKEITQLCKTSGWMAANVGFKYLQVMHRVFMFTSSQQCVKKEEIEQYATLTEEVHDMLVSLQVKISQTSYKLRPNEQFLINVIVDIYNLLIYQLHFVDYFWTLTKEEFKEDDFQSEEEFKQLLN